MTVGQLINYLEQFEGTEEVFLTEEDASQTNAETFITLESILAVEQE